VNGSPNSLSNPPPKPIRALILEKDRERELRREKERRGEQRRTDERRGERIQKPC
jgi:hypothetical protein